MKQKKPMKRKRKLRLRALRRHRTLTDYFLAWYNTPEEERIETEALRRKRIAYEEDLKRRELQAKLDELQKSLRECLLKLIAENFHVLVAALGELSDPRATNKRFKQSVLVTCILICLTLGDNYLKHMPQTLCNHEDYVRELLGVTKEELPEMPGYQALRRAVLRISHDELDRVISKWCEVLDTSGSDTMHIDGKGFRAAAEKVCNSRTSFVLNAMKGNNTYVASVRVGAKTNELKTAPDLFRELGDRIRGITITGDAAFSYEDVVDIILHYGGHFIFPFKGNQKHLEQAINEVLTEKIEDYHEGIVNPYFRFYVEHDNGKRKHGREDYRCTYLLSGPEVDDVVKGTKFEGKVKTLILRTTERYVIKRDKKTRKILDHDEVFTFVCYLSDRGLDLTAEEAARIIRQHWRSTEIFTSSSIPSLARICAASVLSMAWRTWAHCAEPLSLSCSGCRNLWTRDTRRITRYVCSCGMPTVFRRNGFRLKRWI